MSDKKFSSKKYNDYPVIIDNERNVELTLDNVVEILNDYEFTRKLDMREHNDLHKTTKYAVSKRREVEAEKNKLILLLVFMSLIIFVETLMVIGVV